MMIRLSDLLVLIAVIAGGLLLLASPAIIMAWAAEENKRSMAEARAAEPPSGIMVIYTAEWCQPCQKLKKDLDRNPEVLRGIRVEFRDAEELGPINVVIPDIRYVEGGVVKARKVGYTDLTSFTEWLDAHVF